MSLLNQYEAAGQSVFHTGRASMHLPEDPPTLVLRGPDMIEIDPDYKFELVAYHCIDRSGRGMKASGGSRATMDYHEDGRPPRVKGRS